MKWGTEFSDELRVLQTAPHRYWCLIISGISFVFLFLPGDLRSFSVLFRFSVRIAVRSVRIPLRVTSSDDLRKL